MKKLLLSKKCAATCGCCLEDEVHKGGRPKRKSNKQTRKPPKPTLLPNWSNRNDSSNVSAVLHPDDYLQSPRYYRTTKEHEMLEDEYKGVFKKYCLAKNTCYCREQNIQPTLIPRPNTCPCMDEVGTRLTGDDLYRICLCKGAKDAVPSATDRELMRTLLDELKKRCSCLRYSKQRSDYESMTELEKQKGEGSGKGSGEEWGEGSRESSREGSRKISREEVSVATLLGTKTGDSQTASTDINNMAKFRKDHYFDTHSTDDLSKDIPAHTHVHEYKLDDRLIPEPTNVDPYGRSKCTVCDHPKKGGLPCSDDSQTELTLNKKDLERFGGFMGRFRRPDYFNTLALRQQKMVPYKRRLNPITAIYY